MAKPVYKTYKQMKEDLSLERTGVQSFEYAFLCADEMADSPEKIFALKTLKGQVSAWLERKKDDIRFLSIFNRPSRTAGQWAAVISTALFYLIAMDGVAAVQQKKTRTLYAPLQKRMENMLAKIDSTINETITKGFDAIISSPRYAELETACPELKAAFSNAALSAAISKKLPPAQPLKKGLLSL